MNIQIDSVILERVPTFKVGAIFYHNTVIDQSPQMLRGRFQLFLESLKLDALQYSVSDHDAIKEWRGVFKQLHMDPSRYKPSSEALLKRIYSGKTLDFMNGAVDLNNFFSLQYLLPIGIYDTDCLSGDITLTLGKTGEAYESLNGRLMNMEGRLLSKDANGPFGSPIVDSKRSAITAETTNALQLIYLRPSMTDDEAHQLLQAVQKMFVQVNGGSSTSHIIA
ncbi:hypothetical protein A374_09234 [Fictibacillus macauensis ZFHKF-1]|uniref:B3/B4 tRNA-binding domain-containing protein n=1 Tax=Fictibacillus macauensis ZFHKF-1 TaxID=1196324 RepID=I8UGT3_9BACL|nr:hypothetical protein A374_09234 [Fictibacillus macauensis ZFHKF-1]